MACVAFSSDHELFGLELAKFRSSDSLQVFVWSVQSAFRLLGSFSVESANRIPAIIPKRQRSNARPKIIRSADCFEDYGTGMSI